MRDAPRRLSGVLRSLVPHVLCLAASLGVAACGGGGGGDGAGPGGPNLAPAAMVSAPVLGVAGLLGDTFSVTFTASDDGATPVRIVADADGNLGTTGDQTTLFAGVEMDGAQQVVTVPIAAPLTPGAYVVFLDVDDGVNPAVTIVLPRPLVVYPGIAGVAPPRSNRYGIAGERVVFSRGEAEDAAGPLNSDGFADDGVMVLFDATSGTLTQPTPSVSMDVTAAPGARVRPVQSDGGTLAWFTLEADENANLNALNAQNLIAPIGGADVDQTDAMISYVVPAVSPLPITNTYGGAQAIVSMINGMILTRYAEAGEGAGGTIMNGDLDTTDFIFGYVDPAAAGPPYEFDQVVFHRIFPAPSAGLAFRHAGTVIAGWLVAEAGGPFPTDPNADLDQGDTFLALGTSLLAGGTGLPAQFTSLAGFQALPAQAPSPVDPGGGFDVTLDGHAGYYIDEGSHNVLPGLGVGNDRNGDGLIGRVPAFYDANTMIETIPAGAAGPLNSAPGSPLVYDTNRMFFTGIEAPRIDPVAGTNGDGDGGADQNILYWADHTAAGPQAFPVGVAFGGAITLTALSLDNGGKMVKLAPGWIAVVVNELANGNQDINGTGAVDFAYLLIDASSGAAPIVHNPRIVVSAGGTFPDTGRWGEDPANLDQGVVVRLMEQQNGSLDGDANLIEIFFAYISFNTPTQVLVLDGGGNECAVANGRIGMTADEAFTGQDYDGNGLMADVVFRVLDFQGNVLEKGKLCARQSVPVTETGTLWAYLRDEFIENRNLNADPDITDLVLGLWFP